MKMIELKDKVLEINKCEDCPIMHYDAYYEHEYCFLADEEDIYIPKKGVRENCPLKDFKK